MDKKSLVPLQAKLLYLIDESTKKQKAGYDAKEVFLKCIWPEVETYYQEMAGQLRRACQDELSSHTAPIQAVVEHRVKTRASIAKSLGRRELYREKDLGTYKNVHEILKDLHDLVGIRIIVDYMDHLEAVSNFITTTFRQEKPPNEFRSDRKVGRLWPSWFGAYECKNYHISANYSDNNPLNVYNGVIFEIQITSLPANLYNKIAHPLLYKEEAGPLSQGDEIVIDLTKGLAYCYSLLVYFKRYKLGGGILDPGDIKLMRNASSLSEGPEFEASIDTLAGKIPELDIAAGHVKQVPRETLELALESFFNDPGSDNIGDALFTKLRREIQEACQPRINLLTCGKARFDSEDVNESPVCQEGTQTRARQYICDWIDKGEEPLLWIYSQAGTGKSTLARTMARYLTETGQIAAGYFFKRGDKDRNLASRVFPTIANQFVSTIPHYESYLRQSVNACENMDFESMHFKKQLEVLIKAPLSQVDPVPCTKVIIIDALDECSDLLKTGQIIGLLLDLAKSTKMRFRILVTSRDEDLLRTAIEEQAHDSLALASTFRKDNVSDINSILKFGFHKIRQEMGIGHGWPTDEQFHEVSRRSTDPSPLFIYAVTLLRFLYDGTKRSFPQKRLDLWIRRKRDAVSRTQLDEMYTIVFENLDRNMEDGNSGYLMDEDKNDFRKMLGSIVIAAEPLTANAMADILSFDRDEILFRLKACHAVLYVPDKNEDEVSMVHKSFSDFLLDHRESQKQWFRVDQMKMNCILAQGCLQYLEKTLKANICEIQDPGMPRAGIDPMTIRSHISKGLKYASSHWAFHSRNAADKSLLSTSVEPFLENHFLNWVECLAVIGRLDRVSTAVMELQAMNQVCMTSSMKDIHGYKPCDGSRQRLEEFLRDAYRFILKHGFIIQEHPRQTFGSALLFSPTNSLIRKKFWHCKLPNCCAVRNLPFQWGPILQQYTLTPTTSRVKAIAVSPNGKLLALTRDEPSIELWQIETGTRLSSISISSSAHDISWTKDGQELMFVTRDGQVYKHDVQQDRSILLNTQPFEDTSLFDSAISSTGIVAVAHGNRFTTTIENRKISIWNPVEAKTTLLFESPQIFHELVISADAKHVALQVAGTVKLFNTSTNKAPSDIAKTTTATMFDSIAFSSDGDRIFVMEMRSLRIITIQTQISTIVTGPQDIWCTQMAVFPDEKRIATLDFHAQLSVWSIEPDGLQQPETYQRADHRVLAKKFSYGDSSADLPWRIEDADSASKIVMSPSGEYLAAQCKDLLCIWRLPQGNLYKVLVSLDTDLVQYLSFSRDGRSVSAMSRDAIVVWMLEHGETEQIELSATAILSSKSKFSFLEPSSLIGDYEMVWMNAQRIATVYKGQLQMWNLKNPYCHLLKFETLPPDLFYKYGFSPQLKVLAISYGSILMIVSEEDGTSNQVSVPVEVEELSFSPDGSTLLWFAAGSLWTASVHRGAPFLSDPVNHSALNDVDIPVDLEYSYHSDVHSSKESSLSFSFSIDGMFVKGRGKCYRFRHSVDCCNLRGLSMAFETDRLQDQIWIRRDSQRLIRVPPGYSLSFGGSGGTQIAMIDKRKKISLLEFK
ncbi:hypothetical protein FVEG_14893 [Fusarium verticillioides 7600]|uniref:RelA/SpoT domain-containing protein n=1 Tax=Gibberella moniliformis (strain M3125 / FGSC 7600) TaxID=334819 RepID=W7M0N3_GIBM7|nr:hypothetical protein FVEG_14893 [Fusarium verticillioides 7600]EWG38467.1 hypothetical protein FVEG_14893 [Fusarium verticillioides 7600]